MRPDRLLAFLAVAIGCGCHEPTSTSTSGAIAFTQTRVQPSWVTGAAAAAIDADGLVTFTRQAFRTVSPELADSLAIAVAAVQSLVAAGGGSATFTDQVLANEERNWSLCGRTLYVQSAFGTPVFPESTTLDSLWTVYYGPQYAIPICSRGGTPHWWAEIGDGPSGLRFNGISYSEDFGTVAANAIRSSVDNGLPVSPEQAISIVYQSTGARVDQVPDPSFVRPYLAVILHWHVHVERPVTAVDSVGTVYSTRDLYVSRFPSTTSDIALSVAQADQPTATIRYNSSWNPPANPVVDSLKVNFPRFRRHLV